jgi:hypothetical protein
MVASGFQGPPLKYIICTSKGSYPHKTLGFRGFVSCLIDYLGSAIISQLVNIPLPRS